MLLLNFEYTSSLPKSNTLFNCLCFILIGYGLCVLASGSLITDIFSCFTLTKVSCLHFGQYRGKFFSSISSHIFNRVLFLHTGHSNMHILSLHHLPNYIFPTITHCNKSICILLFITFFADTPLH